MARIQGIALSMGLAISVLLMVSCGGDTDSSAGEEPAAQQALPTVNLDSRDGATIWTSCATCHGAQGEGNKELSAPALANQDPWYLKRQMEMFRNGGRGAAPGDTTGSQMAAMAQALPDEEAVDAVVEYIDNNLAATLPVATIEGDAVNGRDHYDMICGACHGPGGEGNAILGAPRLAGIDDWYLVEQYGKFAEGLRGGSADDNYGRQMRMMSEALPDQQTLHNVVVYIQSQAAE